MTSRILILAPLALGAAAALHAQDRHAVLPSCAAGQPARGDLGYSGFSCNCTLYINDLEPARSVYRFRSEPRIEGVKRGSPADGKLRRGDLIVAIDGVLITSEEGGRRFAQIEPGQPVTLTVRRDGRDVAVEIIPSPVCPPDTPETPRAVPSAPSAPRGVEPPTPAPDVKWIQNVPTIPRVPPAPKLASRAWLGFSLRCSQCGWSHTDTTIVWEFSEPPLVEQVEANGPAARAGLRDGDRITHINHFAITTPEGGRLFGAIQPGEQVSLFLIRDQRAHNLTLTAEEPAGQSAVGLRGNLTVAPGLRGRLTPSPDMERFTGTIGNALVQVTGGVVSVTETDDEIVIRSADITVRIRRTDAGR